MFWILAIGIIALAALLTLQPLLRQGARGRMGVLAGVILLPLATFVLYHGVGNPRAMNVSTATAVTPSAGSAAPDMETLTRDLRERLTQSPDDIAGWVLLGRSYKTLQQYAEAVTALQIALELMPGDPSIQVELVEAQLFASGNPRIDPAMTDTLTQAVTADPTLQKGLWLLGIAVAQAGDDEAAIRYWQRLLQVVEPESSVAEVVLTQIDEARSRLGVTSESTNSTAWQGAGVMVELSAAAGQPQADPPENAVLFVIAREPGVTGGPPLGVHRVDRPIFPLQFTLTDADSMLAGRPLSAAGELVLQARLSLRGQAAAATGDWQSQPVAVAAQSGKIITLSLDQRVE